VNATIKQHTVMTPYMVGEVHFYSAEIEGDLVLFDTGPPTPAARAILSSSVDLKRLKYVFITHCHVDHYGLATFIEANSDARIFLPRQDVLRLRRLDDWINGVHHLLRASGLDEAFCQKLKGMFLSQDMLAPTPEAYEIVEDSDITRELGISVLACPGHSQSDLVYRFAGHAVTGDLLLREIFQSPSLDLDLASFEGRFRNYDAYCDSLVKLASLKGDTVLPAHRQYVAGVEQTLLFYVRKLIERAGQVQKFAEVEQVREVVQRIFGDALTNPFVIYLKASEIYFMRDFLADPVRLKTALEQAGLFAPVQELYSSVAQA